MTDSIQIQANSNIEAIDYFDMPEPEIIIEELPRRLPPGEYQGRLIKHETRLDFGGTPKLYLHFLVLQHGEELAKLSKIYPVKKLIGAPKVNGGYQIGAESNVNKDLKRLWGSCGFNPATLRRDRPSFKFLKNKKLTLTVVDVTRDHTGSPRCSDRVYSKVDHIDIDGFY